MTDLIDRQAAIEALIDAGIVNYNATGDGNGMIHAINVIKGLPSAELVRHGKWIIRDNPGTGWYRVTCSECGEDVTANAPCIGFFPNAKVIWNYCPECGADMRGETND